MATDPGRRTGGRDVHAGAMQTRHVDGLTIRLLRDAIPRPSRRCSSGLALALGSVVCIARSRVCRRTSSASSRGSTPSITCSSATSAATRSRWASRGSCGTGRAPRSRSPSPMSIKAEGDRDDADARARGGRTAAGVTELVATVCGDNTPAVPLIARVAESLPVRWLGGERELVARLRWSSAAAAPLSRLTRPWRSPFPWPRDRARPNG